MIKSLFSGVTGLQAHQIAMDVESNNIANVNTVGYKYSRANFADLLAQTSQIATAPQGEMGGKNGMQIGLGTTISSITRIHSQGSIQNTDKNTDLAIQGDGFFIVSSDGGKTYKYTRNGDFKFDATGNFVDNNGFIVQGWVRNENGIVDSTGPIKNIQIKPGLTTPANPTSSIDLKANLSSSNYVTQFSTTHKISSTGVVTDSNGSITTPDNFNILTDSTGNAFQLNNGQGFNISFDGTNFREFRYTDGTNPVGLSGGVYYFSTTSDLRTGLETFAGNGTQVSVDNSGKFVIDNSLGTANLSINISPIIDATTTENVFLKNTFNTLAGQINAGATTTKQSLSINVPTHSSSIDIYDSLGSKHTIKMDFRKTSVDAVNGVTQWNYSISAPDYAAIGGVPPLENVLNGGVVTFGSNGQLVDYSIPSFSFTGNNGSTPNQNVNLNFGALGTFEGMTSFDNPSGTSGISQDGFTGGDIIGIRVDQSGSLIGSFSNGRSFSLAQVSMAKFSNNEGLSSDGGNTYLQSANSGSPIIGTASTAGRGFIQSSSLEGSNVDLSKSLTELIIIQRGYQANAKVITTSDNILETLLGIKR